MTTQRKNINNEQFFTQPETAIQLSEWIKDQPWFSKVTEIIEPSAGDGVWLTHLPVTQAYDLEPKSDKVTQADYLKTKIDYKPGSLMVGNPPFGRMGTLAMKFVQKGCKEVDFIAFILPASFGKSSIKRRVPKSFHLIHQTDMLNETFRFERDGRKVPVVFQVWQRKDEMRKDPVMLDKCADFHFVKVKSNAKGPATPAPVGADLAICTHGSGYGKIILNHYSHLNTRTHRFIKSKIDPNLLASRLLFLNWKEIAKYTVGAPCISTKEIVEAYEKVYSPAVS